MAGKFSNAIGTVLSKFRLGKAGPWLTNDNDEIAFLGPDEQTHANIQAYIAKLFGDDVVLNAGADEAGADWTMTLSRPASGMTQNIKIVMPSGTPSPNQPLIVQSFSAGTLTLGYGSAASGAENAILVDEESLAFGTVSPLNLLVAPIGSLITSVKIIIDTPFNGTPTLSIGITGTTSKYVPSTYIDLAAEAGTVFDIDPGLAKLVGAENIIATYSSGGASVGAARIQTFYAVPSSG